jgi:hypothetical protein
MQIRASLLWLCDLAHYFAFVLGNEDTEMWTYRRLVGSLVAIILVGAAFSAAAVAGTTGVISGKVTAAQSGAPLAGVKVSAVAPTGTYSATTNATGFYSMFGVDADTYTLTFSATGYDPLSVPGVNVFADQSASVDAAMRTSTKTLGKEVVRGVSGGAYQPKQTVDTYTVTQAQINNIQGNSLNISETNLITSLPGAAADSNGYPTIRGGRENEEGFQFEGIPYTDAFTNQFVNTLATPGLGLLNVQLTPGAGSAVFGNSGTGTLNLIARRGAYPAFTDAQVAAGGGQFYHAGNFDYGTAAADGRWSNYFAFSGQNTGFYYGNAGIPAAQFGRQFSTLTEIDREFINNFTYRFGTNSTKSVQLFYDDAQHQFTQGYGGNPYCFPGCDGEYGAAINGLLGQIGANISQQQLASITGFVPYQSGQNQTLASVGRAPATYYQPNHALKLQFDDNVNSTTFFSAKFYQVNAVTTFDFPAWEEFGGSIQQGGFTKGVTADLTSQLGDKNLLKIGADYAYLRPVYNQPGPGQGIESTLFGGGDSVTGLGAFEFLDFLPNDANCPFGVGACGYLTPFLPSLPSRVPQNLEQSIATRQDMSIYIDDTFSATPRLQIEPGLRFDGANYRLPTPGVDPATCTTLYEPTSWNTNVSSGCPIATFNNITNAQTRPRIPEPRFAMSYQLRDNDAIRFSYGRSVEFPPLGQVDLYDPPQAYAGYSKIPSFDTLGFLFTGQSLPANCGIPGFQVPCKNYGEQLYWENQNTFQGVPLQPVKPELFDNYDFSYSHQFAGGFAFKVTPWYRRGYDATASVQSPILVNGQPVSNGAGGFQFFPPVVTNKGTNHATGVELLVTKEAASGLSGQFTATYINEFSNVIPLSGSEDFFPSIPPPSLLLNNLYRVGYLSPFQTSLDLNYQRNGWRISPQFSYDIGYPNGAGLFAAAFVNGVPYNLLNTNASGLINAAPNGTVQYIDPEDPGSFFNPHIAATRGTPEGTWPGGKLDHPLTTANLTIERSLGHNQVLGFTLNNVFNNINGGPVLNARYQPVATGFSGPLSGLHSQPFFPGLGQYNYLPFIRGQNAYVNRPDGQPRSYYLYLQVKM